VLSPSDRILNPEFPALLAVFPLFWSHYVRLMSVAESQMGIEVKGRIGIGEVEKSWPFDMRITLARRILETAEAPAIPEPPRTMSLDQVIGILKTDAPPPTDEECERIVDEERMRKYG
jgi:hypothetical protein